MRGTSTARQTLHGTLLMCAHNESLHSATRPCGNDLAKNEVHVALYDISHISDHTTHYLTS